MKQWLLGFLLLLTVVSGTAQRPETQFRTTRLADNLFLLATGEFGNGNSVALTGPDGALLVDSQYARLSDKLTAALTTLDARSLRYVINTHWHRDHTDGNALLRRAGASISAHENARRRMAAGQAIEFFNVQVPPYPERALATQTITGEIQLHLNGQTVRILPAGPAHTDGDLIVWFQPANVVHLGDLFLNGAFPFVDLSSGGNVAGQLAALERVLALTNEQSKIVPGHGPLATRAELQAWREMFGTVWERVRKAARQQKSLEQTSAARPTAEYDAQWHTPLIPREKFVQSLYLAARLDK